MKATNEAIEFELLNAKTSTYFTFTLRDHAVPAQVYKQIEIDELHIKKASLVKEHNIPVKDDVLVLKGVAIEVLEEINALTSRMYELDLDRMSCVVELKDELPGGYTDERQLLAECISHPSVIPQVMAVFTKRSGSTISLPERGSRPIRFLRPNGEEFDPMGQDNPD